MSKIFNTEIEAQPTHVALLFLRIGIGAFMLVHGLPKLQNLLSGNIQFAEIMGMSAELSLTLAVFAEFFCSILIIVGLGTRLAVIPLIITMLIAVFYVHLDDSFGKQELGLQYLLVYIVLFITGGGKYSVDKLIRK